MLFYIENLANKNYTSKAKNTTQLGFYTSLDEQLNHKHPLYILAKQINWPLFETAFSQHYHSENGRPVQVISRCSNEILRPDASPKDSFWRGSSGRGWRDQSDGHFPLQGL